MARTSSGSTATRSPSRWTSRRPRAGRCYAGLIATADVVVQNLAPGAAARLGLDTAGLRARHPRLIAVDISGYGEGGPYRARAYDLLVQAEAGSCAITGWPDEPAKPGIPVADIGAGMYALAACWPRCSFGSGRGRARDDLGRAVRCRRRGCGSR